MLTLYSLTLTLMLPLILARLFWRSLRQRGYRENIGERFGMQSVPALKSCIWIHAVSVGETRTAEPVIRRLIALYPEHSILLTSMPGAIPEKFEFSVRDDAVAKQLMDAMGKRVKPCEKYFPRQTRHNSA